MALLLLIMALFAGIMRQQALAATDNLFVVSDIAVDVTAQDATQAKMRAIMQAQREGFFRLVRRLAGEKAAQRLSRLSDRDVGRMLSSLSIADEQTGPTRYIAKITVRFDPRKVSRLLRARGIAFTTRQSPPVLVVPVWEGEDGPVLWEDNPWLNAWRAQADEHALVPVLVPVGDDVDRNTITALQAQQGDKAALQALQLRYGADYVLVAIARPLQDGASVQAAMMGRSPGGRLLFDKTYTAQEGGVEQAARLGVRRFIEVMTAKWRGRVLKQAREEAARRAAQQAARARGFQVVVPFHTLREWQQLRARLATTPGVSGVDVQSLSGRHAVVRLATPLSAEDLRRALAGSGLLLQQSGGQWYLRAY